MSEDFIKLYDNFLDPDLCDYLVHNYKNVVDLVKNQTNETIHVKQLKFKTFFEKNLIFIIFTTANGF
jgi:hypothetical protein